MTKTNNHSKKTNPFIELTRRDFLLGSGALLASLLLPFNTFAAAVERVPVIRASMKSGVAPLTPEASLQKLHAGLCRLTGKETAKEAWQSLFNKDQRVGIKLNPTTPPAYSRPETVHLLLQGLKLAGIPEKQIFLWDRFEKDIQQAGFRKLLFDPALRILATEPDALFDKEINYETDKDHPPDRRDDGNISRISRLLTKEMDVCINLGAAKDHISAGVTLCLKNLTFGAMNNTVRFHAAPLHCDPAIPEVYAIAGVGDKVVLSMIDAMYTIYNRGPFYHPQWCKQTDQLFFSLDPVALDRTVTEQINQIRIAEGFRSLHETERNPTHLATAQNLGLGIADPSRIEIVDL